MNELQAQLRRLLLELTVVAPGRFNREATGHYLSEDDDFSRKLRVSPIFTRTIELGNFGSKAQAQPTSYIEVAYNNTPAGIVWYNELESEFQRLRAASMVLVRHSTRPPITGFDNAVAYDFLLL